jgi:glycosyltransferase involved in cell wall biosynthesis
LDLTYKNFFYQKLWVGWFLKKMDKLIAVGNETVKVAKEKGIPENKIVFIPNGVDTEKHLVSASKADLEKIIAHSVENKKVLLTSGRLAKRKGVAWFVANVMPKLSEEFIYVIAGEGPDKQNILSAIKNNKLENRVITLGYVADSARNILLNTADLFMQPNIKILGDMEGFGISVIEAGSCRLPVLASDIEGLKDAIKDGQNGFLVESGNADAFTGKINELFAQGNPREIFGEKVREYVVQNYSWPHIAQKYLVEIEKTIKN